MATWREFESSAPGMAATARLLWPGITALHRGELTKPAGPWFPVAFLATSRPDGSPRLHPFCPILAGGRLFAAVITAVPEQNSAATGYGRTMPSDRLAGPNGRPR